MLGEYDVFNGNQDFLLNLPTWEKERLYITVNLESNLKF